MKKLLLALLLALAFLFQLNAQNYVSTEPTGRNVVLEEFTGRTCGYCTDGHRISNEIAAANPGRFWAINIHSEGYFSPTSYPNLNTVKGNTIRGYFNATSFPSGVVSRNTPSAIDRGQWASSTNTILNETSYLNVGGVCIVNPITRIAIINVEVYYTGDSPNSTNELSIAMLQDSILGSQADYGNYNPSQWYDEAHTIYIHMHTLRDIVNSSNAWGEEISPTTQGTLIQKTYQYEIPEMIGNPNGVEVVIPNLEFVAFVSEESGNNHKYIESANKLEMIIAYDSISPIASSLTQIHSISCNTDGLLEATIMNGGLETLTSMELSIEYNGQTSTFDWTGELTTSASTVIELPITLAQGTKMATLTVSKANGIDLEPSQLNTTSSELICPEWIPNVVSDSLTINIWQDKFGNQITWILYASDSTIIAEGGPYFQLGGNTTKLRTKTVAIPSEPDCIQFAIFDSNCDGINNGHGEGHYNIVDSNGNILFESDGTYTCDEKTNFSINNTNPPMEGDADGNGVVDVSDIQIIVLYIIGQNPSSFNFDNADINNDGNVNVYDIQMIISTLLDN